jgi:hypothetical protein
MRLPLPKLRPGPMERKDGAEPARAVWTLWKPEQEFLRARRLRWGARWRRPAGPPRAWSNSVRTGGRVLQIAGQQLATSNSVGSLAVAATAVLGCGCYEGWLLSAGAACPDAWAFSCSYGLHNVLPSVIWMTQPAELVASAGGFDPAVVLAQPPAARPPAGALQGLALAHGAADADPAAAAYAGRQLQASRGRDCH